MCQRRQNHPNHLGTCVTRGQNHPNHLGTYMAKEAEPPKPFGYPCGKGGRTAQTIWVPMWQRRQNPPKPFGCLHGKERQNHPNHLGTHVAKAVEPPKPFGYLCGKSGRAAQTIWVLSYGAIYPRSILPFSKVMYTQIIWSLRCSIIYA